MAATPAPHVPVSFLLKGAGALFSDACKAALIAAGYDPEAFGSYDHVKSKIDEAKAAVDAGTANASQRFLAGCQSGHLVPNSTYQSTRNNPCTNVGNPPLMYDCQLAPCMPHFGGASDYGTEHYLVTRMEGAAARDARAAGANTPAAIEAAARDRTDVVTNTQRFQQDSNARLDSLRQDGTITRGEQRTGQQNTASAVQAQQASAAHLASASGASPAALTPEEQKAAGSIDGANAVDCIENFRQAYMVAMQKALGQAFGSNAGGTTGSGPGAGGASGSSSGTGPTREQLIHGDNAPQRRECLQRNAGMQSGAGAPQATPAGRIPGQRRTGGASGDTSTTTSM